MERYATDSHKLYTFKYLFIYVNSRPHKILTYQMVKNQNYVVLVRERVRQPALNIRTIKIN